jgi:hypothetical protein
MNEYSRRQTVLGLPLLGLASLGAASVVSRRVHAHPTGLGIELRPYPSTYNNGPPIRKWAGGPFGQSLTSTSRTLVRRAAHGVEQ